MAGFGTRKYIHNIKKNVCVSISTHEWSLLFKYDCQVKGAQGKLHRKTERV